MNDPAKTSLPLQIAGFALLLIGCAIRNWICADIGLAAHFAGDVLFFFQMKRQGCL